MIDWEKYLTSEEDDDFLWDLVEELIRPRGGESSEYAWTKKGVEENIICYSSDEGNIRPKIDDSEKNLDDEIRGEESQIQVDGRQKKTKRKELLDECKMIEEEGNERKRKEEIQEDNMRRTKKEEEKKKQEDNKGTNSHFEEAGEDNWSYSKSHEKSQDYVRKHWMEQENPQEDGRRRTLSEEDGRQEGDMEDFEESQDVLWRRQDDRGGLSWEERLQLQAESGEDPNIGPISRLMHLEDPTRQNWYNNCGDPEFRLTHAYLARRSGLSKKYLIEILNPNGQFDSNYEQLRNNLRSSNHCWDLWNILSDFKEVEKQGYCVQRLAELIIEKPEMDLRPFLVDMDVFEVAYIVWGIDFYISKMLEQNEPKESKNHLTGAKLNEDTWKSTYKWIIDKINYLVSTVYSSEFH